MSFAFNFINRKMDPTVVAEEARLREALAAYFLSTLPAKQQTPSEREYFRRAQRRLAELETSAVLQSANIRRPLRYGDLNTLLAVTLEASSQRLERSGVILKYEATDKSVCTAVEPRLVQMALVRLLHAAVADNPGAILNAYVTLYSHSVLVSVSGVHTVHDPRALALAHTTARLHKGGVMLSEGTVAFSIRRNLSGAVGLFAAPSVSELLNNSLSQVNMGFA